jgi:uncharacterized protein HemX
MDTNFKLKIALGVILITGITVLYGISLRSRQPVEKLPTISHYDELVLRVDSLENVVDSLQTEIQFNEDAFDSRERRYEDVISEYELGLSYLKDYHPAEYKDFHRIIGMKERYSHQLDRENKTRLDTSKF